MIHSASESQYAQIMELSRARNAGWLFITSDNIQPDNNPYDGLPANFGKLVDDINALGSPDSPKGGIKAPPAIAPQGGTDSIETTILDAGSARILPELKSAEDGADSDNLPALPDFDGEALLAELGTHAQTIGNSPLHNGQSDNLPTAWTDNIQLQGSAGEDRFILHLDSNADQLLASDILDFEAGIDQIHLNAANIGNIRFAEDAQRLDIDMANSNGYQTHSINLHSADGQLLNEAEVLKSIYIL